MRTADSDSSLVPFADRVQGLEITRFALGVFLTAAAGLGALGDRGAAATVLGISVGYLVLTAPTLLAPRFRRRGPAIFVSGAALLVDGLYLAVLTYGLTGVDSPLVALVALHCVAVTLLSSFRTGLKVAVWHTLLITSLFELRSAGVLPAPPGSWTSLAVLVAALWLVTLATAAFASVNEREIRRRNYDLLALSRLSLRLEATLRPADVGQALISAVREDQGVRRAVLLAAAGDGLERLVGAGDTPVAELGRNAADDQMIGRAVVEHRTLRVPALDPARDPWLAAALPGADNVILVPVYADGAVAAVLAAEYGAAGVSRVEVRVQSMLERYASHAGLALTNARLLAQMRQLADTDGLTGLANRRTFDTVLLEELLLATSQHHPISLVLVDLDHFKLLNDTLGHQTGDAVLQQVARVLADTCRPSDLVARYGGEEFAVVLPGVAGQAALTLAERLRGGVETVTAAGAPGSVTASLGLAVCAGGSVTAVELIGAADRALYRSKENGRNRVSVAAVGAPSSADAVRPPTVGHGAASGPQAGAGRQTAPHAAP